MLEHIHNTIMQLSATHIASLIHAKIEGDPSVLVDRPSKIEEGVPGTITFLGNPKYEPYLYTTRASIVIVANDFIPKEPLAVTLLRVPDVYAAISKLLEHFAQPENKVAIVSPLASIDDEATIADQVNIGAFTIIEEGAKIDSGCVIHGHCFIGKNVHIQAGTILHPGVRILRYCEIGERCVIHSNAVIGSDGFGFAPQADGSFKKIPQSGNVIIENYVEIGAQCTIDRASIGSTIIRQGVKLDNLIHVAHNVEIGEHTVIAAQTGIAGSTKIGRHCMIGGQVGFVGHITIDDGTKIQAQSGISSSTKSTGQKMFGSPAIDYTNYVKSYAIFKKLPELYKQIARLEKRIAEMEKE